MSKQLATDIVINLSGNLSAKARQYGQSMSQFAANNQRAMNLVKMSTSAVGRGLDNLQNRYVAIGAGLVGGAAVREYSQLDRRISRIAIAADISREKSKELYDQIQQVSNLKGIRVDPSEVTSAIEEILTKTGDLEYAIANLPNIAAVMQATGASGTEVGGIFTEFKKLAIDSNEAAMRAIDTLNLQGKQGAFTLGNLAKEGPKIFAAYASTGRQGTAAVTELGAALQIIRQGVGSDSEAVTAFESLIRDITRPETVKKLKQLGGVEVFDPEQLKKGKEVMRSLPVLIEEIVTKSKGLSTNIAKLNLTDEAKRALKPVIAEYIQTGDVKSFDEFMKVAGDGKTTLNDAAKAAGDFAGSLQLLKNSWGQFSNQQLATPIAELADAINSLDPAAVQNWLETGKNIALVVGGLIAVKKGVDAARWTKGVWDAAKPKGGGGAAGALGSMAGLGATPVYVVNMPGGGFTDMAGIPDGKPGKPGKPGRFSGLKSPGVMAMGALGLLFAASQAEEGQRLGAENNAAQAAKATLPMPTQLNNKDAFVLMSEASQQENEKAKSPKLESSNPFTMMAIMLQKESNAGLQNATLNQVNEQKINASLDVKVSDDRVTVTTREAAPGLKVNVDTGPSLMP